MQDDFVQMQASFDTWPGGPDPLCPVLYRINFDPPFCLPLFVSLIMKQAGQEALPWNMPLSPGS
jgi:hypothetical protein